jgi:hypothetical protein
VARGHVLTRDTWVCFSAKFRPKVSDQWHRLFEHLPNPRKVSPPPKDQCGEFLWDNGRTFLAPKDQCFLLKIAFSSMSLVGLLRTRGGVHASSSPLRITNARRKRFFFEAGRKAGVGLTKKINCQHQPQGQMQSNAVNVMTKLSTTWF